MEEGGTLNIGRKGRLALGVSEVGVTVATAAQSLQCPKDGLPQVSTPLLPPPSPPFPSIEDGSSKDATFMTTFLLVSLRPPFRKAEGGDGN